MESGEGIGVTLENGNGLTTAMEGLGSNLDKENETATTDNNGVDLLQVLANSANADGINSSQLEVETLSAVSETKSSGPPKELGSVGDNGLKKGITPSDQKTNRKGQTGIARNNKPSLSQSLSFPSHLTVAKANNLKNSIDGKPVKPGTPVNGTDSKPSVYTRLSHPTRRVSTGTNSIVAKPSVDGITTRRATLASVPSMRTSASRKDSSVKASVDGPASVPPQSQDQSLYSTSLSAQTKDDDDTRSATSSTTPRGSRRSSGSGFAFRLDERAEKRKEFYSKIEEKIHAKEVERNNLQEKSKESQEAAIKQLRKHLGFKATPMPTFYKEPPPPKTELKKIPSTRPISPKLGRHKTSFAAGDNSADGTGSCQSPVSSSNAKPSKSTGKGSQGNGDSVSSKKTFLRAPSKLPSQKLAAAKTETKLLNSKCKSRDPELEVEKPHEEKTQTLSESIGNPSQEVDSDEVNTDTVLSASDLASDFGNYGDEVAINS